MNDKICGYELDTSQQKIIVDDSNHLLVVAGAGSGKTLTILGKINYLIKYQQVLPHEILCISFTRASASSLKDKIKKEFNLDISVYTFHKLALEILQCGKRSYEITAQDTLDNIIWRFFHDSILEYPKLMKAVLKYFKYNTFGNINTQYLSFYKSNLDKILGLEKLLSTFIHLFKCHNYSLHDFSKFLDKAKRTFLNINYKYDKIFLMLAINIYLAYQNYLEENNEIDFDDMILKSTDYVIKHGFNKTIKYVIIDEYQDVSYIRFLLVKSILDCTKAKLMVVGDDFQSIYRFTGCDIDLFVNFTKYFNDAKVMMIENTYRNSQELIKCAGDFVMKNPYQIKKVLFSNKKMIYPIKIVFYDNIKREFLKLVNQIYSSTKKPILVLGRNNNDIFKVIDNQFSIDNNGKIICKWDNKINLYYLTVHKSKGLEENNVIIINLVDDILGFPCKIQNEKVLRFVSNDFDKYPYNEERRLFYVALTRTKNYVYLLTPRHNYSQFIKELLKKANRYDKTIEVLR